eukprot:1160474-Pelagomonas_calceolata.AAC.7
MQDLFCNPEPRSGLEKNTCCELAEQLSETIDAHSPEFRIYSTTTAIRSDSCSVQACSSQHATTHIRCSHVVEQARWLVCVCWAHSDVQDPTCVRKALISQAQMRNWKGRHT